MIVEDPFPIINSVMPSFYVTGGTVRRDAECYVVRGADQELFENLMQGKYCYVLTSRQMGKSSLMVRTAARLRQADVSVSVLDLTSVGHNLNAEQWYGGLLLQMGQRLELEDELMEYWDGHTRIGPLHRWIQAIQDCVLPRYSNRIIIFIDEIDAVRSLPFSTDEFFAGIRELYNRRSEAPEFERLSFCLLGVALPSDLIRNPHTTPFNIGQRIELPDFTETEASRLATGLGREEPLRSELLSRILYWTGGHPYLTQRLCQAVANDGRVTSPQGIDRICTELFLTKQARERDDNLLFVRERVLRSDLDIASLLSIYEQVRRRKFVADDETDPLASVLRLSGIVRGKEGRLQVRNRIYERAFDGAWVAQNMPDAEKRRQRAAFRRGVLRAAAIAAVILVVMVSLFLYALKQRNLAEQARAEAFSRELATNAIAQLQSDPDLSALLAIEAWNTGQTIQAEYALRQSLPAAHVGAVLRGHTAAVRSVEFSPDGKWVVTASFDGAARVWKADTGGRVAELSGHSGPVHTAVFSPDGKFVLTSSDDQTAGVWEARSGRLLTQFRGHTAPVTGAAFSPDGSFAVTSSHDKTARIWEAASGKEVSVLRGHQDRVWNGAFSSDGRLVVTASRDKTARLWSAATGRSLFKLEGHTADIGAAFSPDGKYVTTWSTDLTACIWESRTGRRVAQLRGHTDPLHTAVFSPDSRLLVSGSHDSTARVWETETGRALHVLRGHTSKVWGIQFSPDGKRIVTSSHDGTARIWEAETGRSVQELRGHTKAMDCAATFSPDGNRIVTGSNDNTARVWEVHRSHIVTELRGHTAPVLSVAFSPDGRLLVTTGRIPDPTVRVWEVDTGRQIGELVGPTSFLRNAAFSLDGRLVVTTNADRTVRVWEVNSGRSPKVLESDGTAILDAVFSPDGKFILTACLDGTARLWRADDGHEVLKFIGHQSRVVEVAFNSDGNLAVTASFDKTARIWETRTGRELAVLRGHQNEVFSAAFSSDGKWVATGDADATVRVWETGSWRKLQELSGHTAGVTRVAFSPDGHFLVSAASDGTVRVWEPRTGQNVSQIHLRSAEVSNAVFSPDGKYIAAASSDNIARIYACEACLPIPDLVHLILNRVTRRLTPSEREKYLHESPIR